MIDHDDSESSQRAGRSAAHPGTSRHAHRVPRGRIPPGAGRNWTIALAVLSVALLALAVILQFNGAGLGWVAVLIAAGLSAASYVAFLWFRLADRSPTARDLSSDPDPR